MNIQFVKLSDSKQLLIFNDNQEVESESIIQMSENPDCLISIPDRYENRVCSFIYRGGGVQKRAIKRGRVH